MAAARGDSHRVRNLALSLVVSGGFLYLAFRNVELDELGQALARVDGGWLLVAVIVSLLIMVFRAWRWQLELRPLEHVPVGRLWVVTSVAYMAINLLPVRLGEIVRPWLLSRRSGVSFSNVVGNLVVEKMMDSICIVVYMLAGLLFIESLPVWVRQGALVPATIAGVFVSVVVLFWWKGEAFVDRWVLRLLPTRFGGRVKSILAAVTAGMRILPNPGLLLAVFVVSLALWFLPILSSYIMIRAFDLNAPFSAALVVVHFYRLWHGPAQPAGHDRSLSVRLPAGPGAVRRQSGGRAGLWYSAERRPVSDPGCSGSVRPADCRRAFCRYSQGR